MTLYVIEFRRLFDDEDTLAHYTAEKDMTCEEVMPILRDFLRARDDQPIEDDEIVVIAHHPVEEPYKVGLASALGLADNPPAVPES